VDVAVYRDVFGAVDVAVDVAVDDAVWEISHE
jgi:hypothetical protein